MEDFEKYKLVVGTHEEGTLQLISDSSTSTSTWQTWKRRRKLGQGAFGEVWQEAWEDKYGDIHYRAVKVCSEEKMCEARIDYKRELAALAAFSKSECASWFVNLHGWWMDSGNLHVAMEYLGQGDLSRFVSDGLLETEIKEIAENVLQGLTAMHKDGFTHRDIKAQNILVFKKPPEFHRWWVKIADFGISKQIVANSETALYTSVGTRPYCAPEVLGYLENDQESSVYDSKVDMWSLGCVLFNLTSRGHLPFSDIDLTRYCDGRIGFNPRNLPLAMSSTGVLFMRALLQVEPKRRPTAAEALHHLWFSKEDATTAIVEFDSTPQSQPTQQQNFNSFLNSTASLSPHPDMTIKKPPLPPRKPNHIGKAAGDTSIVQRMPIITRQNNDRTLNNPTTPQAFPGDSKTVQGRSVLLSGPVVQKSIDSESGSTEGSLNRLDFNSDTGLGQDTDTGASDGQTEPPNTTIDLKGWQEQNKRLFRQHVELFQGTPMHVAARKGDLDILKLLTKGVADIRAKDAEDKTPLYYAALWGQFEAVKWLVEQGAYVNACDDGGSSVIYVAAGQGYLEIVKWLFGRGGRIKKANGLRSTPLHRAATFGHVDVVRWLLERGAEIEAKDIYGWTPLHRATEGGHVETVRCLVEQGANVFARTLKGESISYFAKDDAVAKCLTKTWRR